MVKNDGLEGGDHAMYEHNLVFQCERCHTDIAVSVVRPENNLENVDATVFDVSCPCGWQTNMLGVQARTHRTNPRPAHRITAD